MLSASPSDFILDHALQTGQLGLAAVDENLRVQMREGVLSHWLPEVGAPACEALPLHAMEDAFDSLKAIGAQPLILPSVSTQAAHGERVTIAISWSAANRHFVVVTAPDEGTKALETLLFQDRREKQLLQRQAAAAADRLRVSATLYRDIVESTGDAVLRLRPDLTLSFANGPAMRLLELPGELNAARRISAILPLPAADNPWRPDMCAKGMASFEQPLRGTSGPTLWLWWDVRWLDDADGPGEFQAVGRDITQLRRLRVELDKANEAAQVAALARERLRIAHDLHDTLVRSIVNVQARLSLLRRAGAGGPLSEDLLAAETEAREGLRAARQSVGEIRREFDLPGGPGPALEDAVSVFRENSNAKISLSLDPNLALAGPLAGVAMVRIAREALRNAALHSGASQVHVAARATPAAMELRIEDDGIGFDPKASHPGHYGLVGLQEQARLAKGELSLATAPGAGVKLRLTIPR